MKGFRKIFYLYINRYISRLSMSQKLIGGLTVLVFTIALIATAAVMVSAYMMSKNHFLPANIQAVVKILSEDSVLISLTGEPQKAENTLKAASEYSQIRALAVYNPNGVLHASYNSFPDQFFIPETVPQSIPTGHQLLTPINKTPEEEYTLYIQADASLPAFFFIFMSAASGIILLSFFLLMFMATRFIRRFVTRPVKHLTQVAHKISEQENYSVRARNFYKDEIGVLAHTLNTMLTRIEARERKLTRETNNAEQARKEASDLAAQMQRNNIKLEREIAVRSRVEQKLTHFQGYLNDIIDSMPSALLAIDKKRTVKQCNREAVKLTGLPFKQMVGRPVEHVLPFIHQCSEGINKTLNNQTPQRIEKLPIKLAQSDNYIDIVIYPLSSDNSPGAVIIIDNITRRLRFEEMMTQTEKMLSVGGLAAGMAHEINNPLGTIIQASQNIQRRISSALPGNRETANQIGVQLDDVHRYLEKREINRFIDNIQEAGVRASKIVSNMLLFSRGGAVNLTPANLNELIERTIEIASSDFDLKKGLDFMQIQVTKELDPTIGDINCIASEIQQVLLNLLKNAAFAIHDRNDKTEMGKMTIRTIKEKDRIVIIVGDNGSGMDNQTRKRIFEPFFTTKEIGSGTGLGLSVSYFIITTHHKGTMSVFSVPDKGTEFTISIPLEVNPNKGNISISHSNREVTYNR